MLLILLAFVIEKKWSVRVYYYLFEYRVLMGV